MIVVIIFGAATHSRVFHGLTPESDGSTAVKTHNNHYETHEFKPLNTPEYIDNERLPEVYATHDLFVYPGKWDEPFGRVFLEALASGLPVVSSDVGNVWEIIGEGGAVIEGTVDSFVDTIRELAEERHLELLSREAKRSVGEY